MKTNTAPLEYFGVFLLRSEISRRKPLPNAATIVKCAATFQIMHLNVLNGFLAQATAPATTTPAAPAASAAGGTGAAQPGSPLGLILPLGLMLVILYFMMIRPQSQQRKRQAQLIESLKSGDKIVTASGIVGIVISVKDKTVSLRSSDAKMEVTKSSVVEIIERGGEEKSAS
jgi:preprotein translocase subunit YajC